MLVKIARKVEKYEAPAAGSGQTNRWCGVCSSSVDSCTLFVDAVKQENTHQATRAGQVFSLGMGQEGRG